MFLQGRIEERCAGTLLAWLAREGSDAPADGYFWDDSVATHAPAKLRDTMELARRFSLHVEGMPLLYNLLLAERRRSEHGGDDALVDRYKQDIAEWAARETLEQSFDPAELWTFAAARRVNVPRLQRNFVEAWTSRLSDIGRRRDRRRSHLAKLDRKSRTTAERAAGTPAQPGPSPGLDRRGRCRPDELPLASGSSDAAGLARRARSLMLSPDSRTVAFDLLRLRAGHELDFALLTTYTLDLEALLALPLGLVARSDNGPEDLLADPLLLLEALRRAGERIHVFVDRSGIAIPRARRELYALLEPSVHPVCAPGGGAFHPKVWVLRFLSENGACR